MIGISLKPAKMPHCERIDMWCIADATGGAFTPASHSVFRENAR
jgi:hypothetical protein